MRGVAEPADAGVADSRCVSVIIASFNSAATIGETLKSLQAQQQPGQHEIIVVDSSPDSRVADVVHQYPSVRLIHLRQRAYPGLARNTGVAASGGDILAFTDADCTVGRHWIQSIRRVHQGDVVIAGGTIANANPQSWIGWMYYFCKFSHWLPMRQTHRLRDIPTTSLTMQRAVFEQCGPFRDSGYSSDSAFNWNTEQYTTAPVLSPQLQVAHHNFTRTSRVLSKLFQHARDYASLRAANEQWSRRRCWLMVVTTPALIPLLFLRTARKAWDSRVYRWQFMAAAPLVVLGYTAWALGELAGYARAGRHP